MNRTERPRGVLNGAFMSKSQPVFLVFLSFLLAVNVLSARVNITVSADFIIQDKEVTISSGDVLVLAHMETTEFVVSSVKKTMMLNDEIIIKEDKTGKYVDIKNHNIEGEEIIQKYKNLALVKDLVIIEDKARFYFKETTQNASIHQFFKNYFNR